MTYKTLKNIGISIPKNIKIVKNNSPELYGILNRKDRLIVLLKNVEKYNDNESIEKTIPHWYRKMANNYMDLYFVYIIGDYIYAPVEFKNCIEKNIDFYRISPTKLENFQPEIPTLPDHLYFSLFYKNNPLELEDKIYDQIMLGELVGKNRNIHNSNLFMYISTIFEYVKEFYKNSLEKIDRKLFINIITIIICTIVIKYY